MVSIHNLRISGKIGIVIAVLAFASATISAVGYYGLSELAVAADRINEYGNMTRIGARMNDNLTAMNRAEYRFAANPTEADDIIRAMRDAETKFAERLDRLSQKVDPERRAPLERIRKDFEAYRAELKGTIEVAARHKNAELSVAQREVYASVQDSVKVLRPLTQEVGKFVDDMDEAGNRVVEDAAAQAAMLNRLMIGVAAAGILFGVFLGLAIARVGLVNPIAAIINVLKQLAGGNLSCEIAGTARKDEIGDIARAALVFRDNAREAETMRAEQEAERKKREERARAIESLTHEFDRKVSGMLEIVSSACSEMDATAQSLSANAEQTSRQSAVVASATEEASSSVQTVATAAEELSASISEIGRQIEHATTVSRRANDEAGRTNARVRDLADISARIGEVVNLINDIASQTNLLALNATIEAARAGEAGKGFAVVAGEVKTLANQTAKATDEIGQQIGGVQSATEDVVGAIAEIATRIGEINEVSAAIASAVEQQIAAAAEIARNVQQAASGTQEIAANIEGVNQAAGETGAASQQVLSASQSLSQEAVGLRSVVEDFLAGVRAA
ncbi:Chemotaxis sensory transducer [uncultured Alphaproteobacteria bacterium]|uniref:Chemotaxis sensory transducer n=1 Tax=uncultured Alphaproteobacteria bacterium TaxID=91750 RepID=A0A212J233_9PROT|nr:Chemotaxis sensory transducer [uncultured Alphaproteobacteria bacterium]